MSITSHEIAIAIEVTIRNKLDCKRFEFSGIADTDFIDYGGAYTAFVVTLSHYCGHSKRDVIDAFLSNYSYLYKKRIEDVEQAFEQAYKEFEKLVNSL